LPQDCSLCAAPSGDDLLCADCRADLPQLDAHCPCCANPSPAARRCGACLAEAPHFDATIALWPYVFPLDRLIHALKYQERLAFATLFGTALAASIRNIDLLLPMPLHPARLRQRGFNQAVEIGRCAARVSGVPMRSAALQRVRDTTPQTDLAHDARARNVRGAFICLADLSGLRVALIDDVMTTGASLNEAARSLKQAGATYVENHVVARALIGAADA
jgi:ComF family protein